MRYGRANAADAEARWTAYLARGISDGFVYLQCYVHQSAGKLEIICCVRRKYYDIFTLINNTTLQAPPYGSNSLSPQYGGGQTVGSSPQAAASPHLTASPQVPSPQGQTLDLSVNRLHRLDQPVNFHIYNR